MPHKRYPEFYLALKAGLRQTPSPHKFTLTRLSQETGIAYVWFRRQSVKGRRSRNIAYQHVLNIFRVTGVLVHVDEHGQWSYNFNAEQYYRSHPTERDTDETDY